MAVDPIHQFQIIDLFPVVKIGHTEIAFTNSAAYMAVAVVVIMLFLIGGTARRSLVPGRLQSAAELSYEFVANTIRSTAGTEGMRFFPFVFTLFFFVRDNRIDPSAKYIPPAMQDGRLIPAQAIPK